MSLSFQLEHLACIHGFNLVTDRGRTCEVKMGRTDEYMNEKVAYIYMYKKKCGHIITKVQRARKYNYALQQGSIQIQKHKMIQSQKKAVKSNKKLSTN